MLKRYPVGAADNECELCVGSGVLRICAIRPIDSYSAAFKIDRSIGIKDESIESSSLRIWGHSAGSVCKVCDAVDPAINRDEEVSAQRVHVQIQSIVR